MGNRNAKNEQLIVATGTEMKRRPWLEPLSRDGIPLQIFGFRGSSYEPGLCLWLKRLNQNKTREYLDQIISFKGNTENYIMTKLRDLGIEELPQNWTIQTLLEHTELMRKNGGEQEHIQKKLSELFRLNAGDGQLTTGNEIYTILFNRIDGYNDADKLFNQLHNLGYLFSIDFLELFERYYNAALFGNFIWGGIKEQIGLEAILRCMLQKEPAGSSWWWWFFSGSNNAANSRKLQRDELLQFADAFDDQLLQECSQLNAKRKTKPLSPIQKCVRSLYTARYIRESLEIEGIHVSLDELKGLVREINLQREMTTRVSLASREFVGLWHATVQSNYVSLEKISLQEILSMHEMVLADNDELKGRLRKNDVGITDSPFVPVEHRYVQEEMARFITLIQRGTDQFPQLKENPVEFAALIHFIFVLIHPFGDGNGRMGRLVMNYVLQKFGYPALILKGDNENRQLYYRAIHQACMGNVRAFVRYIAEQMLRTLLAFKVEGEYTLAHIENPSMFTKSWP